MLLDDLRHDLRLAWRNAVKYPIACAVAVVSLGAGIGATTATLIVRAVVFTNPPPLYARPAQISTVDLVTPERPRAAVPAALLQRWIAIPDLGGAVGAIGRTRRADLRAGDRFETTAVRTVTPNLFDLLGVRPAIGRSLSDVGDTALNPAVLSARAWHTLFDGRPDVVGRELWIGTLPLVVVGVMPERFYVERMDGPIWTPFDPRRLARDETVERVFVRRADGASASAVEARLESGLSQYAEQRPAAERRLHVRLWPVDGTPVAHEMPIVLPWLLAGAVLLTLLIACANVAVLEIAQWTTREQEIAIRAALGASRGRIVRSLVTESTAIAAAGGALGASIAFALLRSIEYRAGPGAAFYDLSLSRLIFAQVACLSLGAGVLAGIGPALFETRRMLANPLRLFAAADRVRQRWRHSLVVVEIAVTVALLVVTATMLGSYRQTLDPDPGFRIRPLVTARVENDGGVPIDRIVDAVSRLPGVERVAAATAVPIVSRGRTLRVSTSAADAPGARAEIVAIGPGFFETLDVPMRAGRGFSRDELTAGAAAIVNEALAAALFPAQRADEDLGAPIWIDSKPHHIVGIVANFSNQLMSPRDRPVAYVPIARNGATEMRFLIRAAGEAGGLADVVRRELRARSEGSVVTDTVGLDQIRRVGSQEFLVGTLPLVPLIGTAMLLTAAGVYGVLAFAIARRSRELAVRVAIGASRRDLVRLVSAHSVRIVTLGVGLGLAATVALARVVRASGGAGSWLDPTWRSFAIPALVVFGIGAVATWIPSRRAITIDPATVLRQG